MFVSKSFATFSKTLCDDLLLGLTVDKIYLIFFFELLKLHKIAAQIFFMYMKQLGKSDQKIFPTLFLCFALFILLTLDVFNKFFKGMTNVGIVSQGIDNSSKVLPCVTLCPWSGNKVNLMLLIFLTYSPGSNKHCCTVLNIRSHKQVFNYKVPIAI